MGGIIPGDRYHNILFQNPGQGNRRPSAKLVGKKTNRAAIGARIKVVTAGDRSLTIHIALLQVAWPASGTTQVFRDLDAGRAIEVTEFATSYRGLRHDPIPSPE